MPSEGARDDGPTSLAAWLALQEMGLNAAALAQLAQAGAAYDAGAAVVPGLVTGLRAELAAVDREMTEIADRIIAEVQARLGLPPEESEP
jgi:hypothetical protein